MIFLQFFCIFCLLRTQNGVRRVISPTKSPVLSSGAESSSAMTGSRSSIPAAAQQPPGYHKACRGAAHQGEDGRPPFLR